MIAAAIIQLLHGIPALTEIVEGRISPNIVLPGDDTPAVYVLDYNMEEMNCDSSNKSYSGTVEIGVHAEDYKDAAAGSRAIREALKDYSGEVALFNGDGTVGMSVSRFESSPDGFEEEGGNHVKIMEFEIFAKVKS